MALARRVAKKGPNVEDNPLTPKSVEKTEGFVFSLLEPPHEPLLASAAASPEPNENQLFLLQNPAAVNSDEAKAVFARVEPISADENKDEEDFSMREQSLKPQKQPTSVTKLEGTFPAAGASPAPPGTATKSEPLEVVRFLPEGLVQGAVPELLITFSHPMIFVGCSEAVNDESRVPVQLIPKIEGRWRWLGTNTITFQPTYKFPMSTKYNVTIPAGTSGANGNSLGSAVTFSFQTGPLSVTAVYPPKHQDSLPLAFPIFISFDQTINGAKLLPFLSLRHSNSTQVGLALIEKDEAMGMLEKLPSRKSSLESALANAIDGRWLLIKPSTAFPPNSPVQLTIKAGAPSAEGPLTLESDIEISYRTYPPFNVGPPRTPSQPLASVFIELTNEIDESSIVPDEFVTTPAIAGNYLVFRGRTKGKTKYDVKLSPNLRDVFGQTLLDPTATFSVGSSYQTLNMDKQGMYICDPAVLPEIVVSSTNLRKFHLVVKQVVPSDFSRTLTGGMPRKTDKNKTLLDDLGGAGKIVSDTMVDVTEFKEDEPCLTKVALTAFLANKDSQGRPCGHLYIGIEPSNADYKEDWTYRPIYPLWVQVTKLGISVLADRATQECQLWATDINTGAPLAGVTVAIAGQSALTNEAGLASFKGAIGSNSTSVHATLGNDVTFIAAQAYGHQPRKSNTLVCTFDDRKLYKPKEEVHIKGYIRVDEIDDKFRKISLPDLTKGVTWEVVDSRRVKIASGAEKLTALGSFDLKFKLPDNINLGATTVEVTYNAISYHHSIRVEEFRRPEFKLTCSASSGPYIRDSSATLTAAASYYSGGALAAAQVSWQVSSQLGSYSPPGFSTFQFGPAREATAFEGIVKRKHHFFSGRSSTPTGPMQSVSLSNQLDGSGSHSVQVKWAGAESPSKPVVITAHAVVRDATQQAIRSSASLLVHPSNYYVGIRQSKRLVKVNEALPVQFVVVDTKTSKSVADVPIAAKLELLDTKYDNKTRKYVSRAVSTVAVTVNSSGDVQTPAEFLFKIAAGGQYRISAEVEDSNGWKNQSTVSLHAYGGAQPFYGMRQTRNAPEEISVLADKDSYAPGDLAHFLVSSPFKKAYGIYHLVADGILEAKSFVTNEEGGYEFDVPVLDKYSPNISVHVNLVGFIHRTDPDGTKRTDTPIPPRPARGTAAVTLRVSASSFRALRVEVAAEGPQLLPGEETSLKVHVDLPNGKPADKAEVCLIVVDEAVLALANYSLPNVLSQLTGGYSNSFSAVFNRDSIHVADWESLLESLSIESQTAIATQSSSIMPQGKMLFKKKKKSRSRSADSDDDSEPDDTQIEVRRQFDPLALFVGSLTTNASGNASANLKMPDTLTSYRIWAVAAHGPNLFGQTESSVVVQLPLAIRPSIPQFLNFGDKAELSVVVVNQSSTPQSATVVARATNLQISTAGFKFVLQPEQRAHLKFPAETACPGVARIQFALASETSKASTDAIELKVPVYTPATTEAFATYGEIDESNQIVQPILPPSGVFPHFGGLSVTTTSTALSALTDAFLYLYNYHFDCTEQISSRLLGIIALEQVLRAFKVEDTPSPARIQDQLSQDLFVLRRRQFQDNGGFAFWSTNSESHLPISPYASLHACHALARFEKYPSTIKADEVMLTRAKKFVGSIQNYIPSYYGNTERAAILAYAYYVKNLFGLPAEQEAVELYKKNKGSLSIDAVCWVWQCIKAAGSIEAKHIREDILKSITETPSTATVVTGITDTGKHLLMQSSKKTDGVVLETLILKDPNNKIIPKLVKGLLAGKSQGRWGNTQENCMVLLGLKLYFDTFEKATPNFTARTWLDDIFAGQVAYTSHSTEAHEVQIPMAALQQMPGLRQLTIDKDGNPGRLYYRLGIKYAPTDLKLKAANQGFDVQRKYLAVENSSDVTPNADTGEVNVKLGAMVRIRVTVTNVKCRYHVALQDKLPAGFEVVNTNLKTSVVVPDDVGPKPARRYWWQRSPFDHQNIRTERVEAFSHFLYSGTHVYTYVCRATTAGRFVAPPATAEEMYSPEVFGRTASEIINIQ